MQIAIATSLSTGAGFTHAKLSFEDWNAYCALEEIGILRTAAL
jgi:hypothetical protein